MRAVFIPFKVPLVFFPLLFRMQRSYIYWATAEKEMFSQTTATTGSLTADCSAYHRVARNRFTTHFMAVSICSIQTTRYKKLKKELSIWLFFFFFNKTTVYAARQLELCVFFVPSLRCSLPVCGPRSRCIFQIFFFSFFFLHPVTAWIWLFTAYTLSENRQIACGEPERHIRRDAPWETANCSYASTISSCPEVWIATEGSDSPAERTTSPPPKGRDMPGKQIWKTRSSASACRIRRARPD